MTRESPISPMRLFASGKFARRGILPENQSGKLAKLPEFSLLLLQFNLKSAMLIEKLQDAGMQKRGASSSAAIPTCGSPYWKTQEAAKEQMLWSLHQADVVKISDNEVEFLWGCTPEAGAEKLLTEFGVTLAMVTLGPDGCLLKTKNASFRAACPKVYPIDTTGAGDIFGGSAMARLLELGKPIADRTEADLAYIGVYAATVASLSTQATGGIPSIPEKATVLKVI